MKDGTETSKHHEQNSILTDTIVTHEQPTPNAGMLDIGAFAQHKWVIDPKYWTLNTGLRFDFINTTNDTAFHEVAKHKYVNGEKKDMPPNNTILFNKGINNQFAYAAHIDLEYKPTERNKLILSLANAYRVASLEERFKYIDQAGDLKVGNPNLKPEKGLFSNLSYAYTANKIILKTDVFANYLFDLIAEKQRTYINPSGTAIPNAWASTNVEKAYFLGGELDFTWMIIKDLVYDIKLSYVYAVDATTKENLPRIPPLFSANTIEYNVIDKFLLYGECDWDLVVQDLEGKPIPWEFTAVFNAGFETKAISLPFADLVFAGGVHNLFNKAFEDPMSTLRGINKLEAGRNLFLRAKIEF